MTYGSQELARTYDPGTRDARMMGILTLPLLTKCILFGLLRHPGLQISKVEYPSKFDHLIAACFEQDTETGYCVTCSARFNLEDGAVVEFADIECRIGGHHVKQTIDLPSCRVVDLGWIIREIGEPVADKLIAKALKEQEAA